VSAGDPSDLANLATYRGYHLGWPQRRKSLIFNALWIGQIATWGMVQKLARERDT